MNAYVLNDIDAFTPTWCNRVNLGGELGGKRSAKIPPKLPMKLRHIFLDFYGTWRAVCSFCAWVVWALNVEVAVCFVVSGCTCFIVHLNFGTLQRENII